MEIALPIVLEDMIRSGFWPSTRESELAQNLRQIVCKERVVKFAPDEERLYLFAPPFYTVEQRLESERGEIFWKHPMAAVHEIDPALALDIGDFGLGSDSPIILDYRHDKYNPTVLRLRWSTDRQKPKFSDNHWVKIANDFTEFAAFLRG